MIKITEKKTNIIIKKIWNYRNYYNISLEAIVDYLESDRHLIRYISSIENYWKNN